MKISQNLVYSAEISVSVLAPGTYVNVYAFGDEITCWCSSISNILALLLSLVIFFRVISKMKKQGTDGINDVIQAVKINLTKADTVYGQKV